MINKTYQEFRISLHCTGTGWPPNGMFIFALAK